MTITAIDIVGALNELPPFPKVTAKLLELLEDDSVNLTEISDVLSHDPALSIKVVMMSNSPFYMVSSQIESIQDAVLVLGIGTVSTLALSISLHNCLSAMSPQSSCFDMTAFWKHSYATAIAGRQVCLSEGTKQCERVYLAGLVHDIGKLIQGYKWPEAWRASIRALDQSDATFAEIERNYFSVGFAEITSALCEAWRMSPKIIEMIDKTTSPHCSAGTELEHSSLCIAHAIAKASGFSFPLGESENDWIIKDGNFDGLIKSLPDNVEHQLSTLSS